MNKHNIKKLRACDLLPKDPYSISILNERALKLSEIENVIDEKKEMISYIRFCLNTKENYGIPYQDISQILDKVKVTKVPTSQEIVAGAINCRGELLTVIDLKKFLHLPMIDNKDQFDVIVTKNRGLLLGFLADFIEGSDEYNQNELKTDLSDEGVINTKYIKGLHHGKVAILNIEEIILDYQQLIQNN